MFQLKEDLLRDALSDASPKTATCLAVFKIIGFDFFPAVTALFLPWLSVSTRAYVSLPSAPH